MTVEKCFETYCENIIRQRELDESLFDTEDRGKWKENLLSRAKKMREMNLENSDILAELQRKLQDGVTREEADEMMNNSVRTIIEGMSDAALQYPVLNALADYYKSVNALPEYITSVFFAGFVEGEILLKSCGMEKADTRPEKLVIAERSHYTEFEDQTIRSYILMSYNNLANCSVIRHEDIPESYNYLCELEAFWNSPEVQAVDGENPEFIAYMEIARRLWLQLDFEKSDLGTPACEHYCKYAKELYDKMVSETGGDVSKYLIQTYGPYLNSRAILGEMTYEEAAELYYVKYRDYMDQALGGRDDYPFVCFGLIPVVSALAGFADRTDGDTKKRYYEIINGDLAKFGGKSHSETHVDSNINQMLAEMCIKSISTVGDRAEKEKLLFNLVIKRQLLTYIHSMMVTRISEIIADHTWEAIPGYFGETGFTDKEEFLSFVRTAASLHDLGKIKITDIVNMQRRRLDEEEFHGIRSHPDFGARVVKNDKDLEIYKDIILGHHRFYDGRGGYPADFDNTSSKYRKIIDVVTLADCLDAATDCYSRNYKPPRSFDDVLGEFTADAGTRYNGEIVAAICASGETRSRLARVVNEERLDMMYEAYSQGREMYI